MWAASYFSNFVNGPLTNAAAAAAVGHPINLPSLDFVPLAAHTLGMFGLGGLHVTQRVRRKYLKFAASSEQSQLNPETPHKST